MEEEAEEEDVVDEEFSTCPSFSTSMMGMLLEPFVVDVDVEADADIEVDELFEDRAYFQGIHSGTFFESISLTAIGRLSANRRPANTWPKPPLPNSCSFEYLHWNSEYDLISHMID